MNALKILERPQSLTWDYDAEADVLYLSVGEPRPAVSVDLGNGLIVRYDEDQEEVVGLTVMDLRTRLTTELAGEDTEIGRQEV